MALLGHIILMWDSREMARNLLLVSVLEATILNVPAELMLRYQEWSRQCRRDLLGHN